MQKGLGDLTPKATEDFLFHFYRGHELLADDCPMAAKEELTRALELKPGDAKGQDLLAVAYFRLGQYPDAGAIYESLLGEYPRDERISENLSLCYQKMGEPERAREVREQALPARDRPSKVAWSALKPPERASDDAPGEGVPRLADLIQTIALPFPTQGAAATRPGGLVLLRAETGLALRRSAVHFLSPDDPDVRLVTMSRRRRGRSIDEPLGGPHDPLVLVDGPARATLAAGEMSRLWAFRFDGDLLFLREAAVVGFEARLSYENGHLAAFEGEEAVLIQLRGSGTVVLSTRGSLVSAPIKSEGTALVARDAVVGWSGRLLPRVPAPYETPALGTAFVSFTGEGTVFLLAGPGAAEP
jgi:tetratricopeptide (TPR) repeat protein